MFQWYLGASKKGSRKTASHIAHYCTKLAVPGSTAGTCCRARHRGVVRCVRFPLGGAAAVAAASVIVFLPGCPRCGVPWSTGRMLLICAPIIGGAQSWICRRRIVIRWALPNKQLARSPSIAEPSVVQADDDASHGPASSLARQAYFSLVSLRCLFAVLQPACFSSPGLSESMRAP